MSTLNAEQQKALDEHVILLCPSIGYWRGQYQLPQDKTETKTAGQQLDQQDITTPRAKLMTDRCPLDQNGMAWQKRFQAIDSRLNSIKARYSVPFPISGVRIVPKSRGKELFDMLYGLTYGHLCECLDSGRADLLPFPMTNTQMYDAQRNAIAEFGSDLTDTTPIYDPAAENEQSVAYELEKAKREFCANWSNIRQQIADTNKVFQHVQTKVPMSGKDMAAKFYLDVMPIEIAGSQSTELTHDALRTHNAVVREVCQRRVSEAIEEMIAEPRNQLAKALSSLQDLIANEGKVTAKSFNPVRAAIEKIRMFDFVANDQLLMQIKDLETRIDRTQPRDLTPTHAAQSGFTAAIDAFMTEVNDENKRHTDAQQFGRVLRRVNVGRPNNEMATSPV